MCIISWEIESVHNKKIIAAEVNNDKQLTIYSNKVDTENPVAMICHIQMPALDRL
jgi:hypothetical protein